MISKISLLFFFILFYSSSIQAQNSDFTPLGGEFVYNVNKYPCLTNLQRANIKSRLQNNVEQLKVQNKWIEPEIVSRGSHASFIWPVQKAAGVSYNDVWSISNYVDHNTAYPNQLTDYNCGTRTYDTNSGYNHQGIDIFTWPFSWKLMDNDEAEIIAGASGQIISKSDGQFDRSCGFNNNQWNAVYIQHSDGSIAWYGHMKSGSLTTKNVGESVTQGEYLGIIGSSGNSTGPHLHFEIYEDNSFAQLIDPYSGTCNSLNGDSWWQSQKPYSNPNINAVLTHNAPPVFPTCPTTETTNESDLFNFSDTIYFGLYLRDQASGTNVNLKIIRPDNSILYDWNFNLTADYTASWWYWSNTNVFNVDGEWKWQATYQGQTVTHPFTVEGNLGIDELNFNATSIYPNPFKDVINISSQSFISNATIMDISGKLIKTIHSPYESIESLSLRSVSNGMYFLILESDSNQMKIIKLIKK